MANRVMLGMGHTLGRKLARIKQCLYQIYLMVTMALHFLHKYRKYLVGLAIAVYIIIFMSDMRERNTRCRTTMPDWDSIPVSPRLRNTMEPRCMVNINELGVVQLDQSPPDISEIEAANRVVAPGGRWAPTRCAPRQHVAILIPYRDRLTHLELLIRRLHPMLRRQKASYQIFVIEQAGNDTYNKGILFNVGIKESLRHLPFECFIFHDVDLLPENDKNIYFCDEHLRQFSSAIDEWRYTLLYANNAGGVVALNYDNVVRVNGYPNMYWGWGGEDDDFSARTLTAGLLLTRPPQHIGRYSMVRHKKRTRAETASTLAIEIPTLPGLCILDNYALRLQVSYDMFVTWESRWKTDGLNSLEKTNYTVLRREKYPLYTWILVDVGKPPSVPITAQQPKEKPQWMHKFLTQ